MVILLLKKLPQRDNKVVSYCIVFYPDFGQELVCVSGGESGFYAVLNVLCGRVEDAVMVLRGCDKIWMKL